MNSAMHTEPRSSVSSLPEHRHNRPPRTWFVIRHRCHFVNHRLSLATQTTIESAHAERTASAIDAENICRQCSVCLQSDTLGAVLPNTEARTTTSAVGTRNAAGASNPNEKFINDGSGWSGEKICCYWLEAR